LDGLSSLVPILSVPADTFETAIKIGAVRSYITDNNRAKTALSLKLFVEYVDTEALEQQLSRIEWHGLTPKMFIYNLVQQAKSDKHHIVLPEGDDERILRAAEVLLNRDIVDLTILGNPDEIKELIQKLGLNIPLDKVSIFEPQHAPQFAEYVQTLLELRKHKGMTLEAASDFMCDVSYFGTMMVYKGDADGMVSGATHTTQHTIRPALQFVKTKPGFSVVSSVFFMCLDDRVLIYGDCAVNPDPTAEQLAEIAISSADTAQAFGIEPKVALLSYSTGESVQGAEVEKVRQATKIAQERRPDLKLEGPIQYDAAVDAGVAAKKMPNSAVAGRASVLIFPDLNTGNNTYKAVQRETGAIAIGPILQGLNKPVNDLSRGCTVEDIINTVVMTAIQAQTA
jgi:phosphate acetyltransferase